MMMTNKNWERPLAGTAWLSGALPGGAQPENFKRELLFVLSEQIERYTAGKSSSVPMETAENILQSILYCVKAYLQAIPDAGTAALHITPRILFQEGQRILSSEVEKARHIWTDVKKTRIPTDLYVYNSTVDEGIKGFFSTYDLKFAAHENGALCGFPDYPLFCDDRSLEGILYMKRYLEQMKRENIWCAQFGKNKIRSILLVHGLKYHLDYREMIVNIPELVVEYLHLPKPDFNLM